jgi:hypothetical protein
MFSKHFRADLALGFTALIWGATFVVVKDALADVSVFSYIAVRFALAAVVMAIFFRHSLRGLTRSSIWAGAQIGFFMFAGYAFQTTRRQRRDQHENHQQDRTGGGDPVGEGRFRSDDRHERRQDHPH